MKKFNNAKYFILGATLFCFVSCLKKAETQSSSSVNPGVGSGLSGGLGGQPFKGSCLLKANGEPGLCLNIYTKDASFGSAEHLEFCTEFFTGLGAAEASNSACPSLNAVAGKCAAIYSDGALEVVSYGPIYTSEVAEAECLSNAEPWKWVVQGNISAPIIHQSLKIAEPAERSSIKDAVFRN